MSRHRQHLAGYLQAHKTNGNNSANIGRVSAGNMRSTFSKPGSGSSNKPEVTTYQKRLSVRNAKFSGRANINDLPDELLLKVFSYLEPSDLLTAARVCKRWIPVACDNELWSGVYKQFCRSRVRDNGAARLDHDSYKALCIRDCSQRRKKLCNKHLKKINPFTGLPRDSHVALKAAGVYFQLSVIDNDKNETTFHNRDMFCHHMSVTLRWYELELPVLSRLKSLQVCAINPLFFNANGSAIANSPYQKSLLLSADLNWSKWQQTNQPMGTDDLINIYNLSNGIAIATWKGDGDLAFITISFHWYQLVERCLYGSAVRPFDVNTHKVIPDDIDSTYGLHGYQCTVDIRNQRASVWSQQFGNLSCKKENLGSGYAKFALIRKECHYDHVIFTKALQFPWKTDNFKGIVDNVVWLDITVLDERDEPFWCVSSLARISSKKLNGNLDFDYSMEEVYVLSYVDERGKLEAQMSKTDEGLYFMTGLELKLSLAAINSWFQTSYR